MSDGMDITLGGGGNDSGLRGVGGNKAVSLHRAVKYYVTGLSEKLQHGLTFHYRSTADQFVSERTHRKAEHKSI